MLRPAFSTSSSQLTHILKQTSTRSFSTTVLLLRNKMNSQLDLPIQPPVHRGMTLDNFDRSAFTLKLPVLAARIPAREIGRLKKELSSSTLALSRIPSVLPDPDSKEDRLLLLDKPQQDQLPVELLEIIHSNHIQLRPHEVVLNYDYWNANQILRAILPEELLDELPSSFTTTGHIAHFNLREEYLPYKHLIGQIVLDKNRTIETVVNKVDTIDTEFRFFQMEVLAGRPNFNVELSEGNCRFRFDFSKVYWNSRLQGEHNALVDSFDVKDVVCDGFAGVGPFAVPAAKKGCLGVLASDLNPASAESLSENAKLNKLGDNIRCYNMDGRDFFRMAVIEAYKNPFRFSENHGMSARAAARKARQEREARKAVAASSTSTSTSTSTLPSSAPTIAETAAIASTASPKSTGPVQNGANEPASTPQAGTSAPSATTTSALGRYIDHFVLNLPATAIEFLDVFQNIYVPLTDGQAGVESGEFLENMRRYTRARGQEEGLRFPMVHCYCFTRELEQYEADINERATRSLGYPVSSSTLKDYSLTLVRSVAPNKDMYRLSFSLPAEVVLGHAATVQQ